jgi:plasmid stabilization system protein ParE
MSRLIWSPAALMDVKRLYDFLKPKDLDVPKRALKAIRQGVKVLENQSGVGRPVEDMENEFRDWALILATAAMWFVTGLTSATSRYQQCAIRKRLDFDWGS